MRRFHRHPDESRERRVLERWLDRSAPTIHPSAEDETAELVRLAQAGERLALDELFDRYRGPLLDLARRRVGARLRLREDPEDLAQTAFREAARDLPRYEYRGERSLLHWLSQILENKIRDRSDYHVAAKRDVRRVTSLTRPRDDRGDELPLDLSTDEPTSVQRAVREEELSILRTHVRGLSPLPRRAVRLVYFEGLSLREAGQRLGGRSEDAVRMLVRRAALRLRAELERALG